MKHRLYTTGLAALLVVPMLGCTGPHSLEPADTTADLGLPRATPGGPAQLLSAFFGLDNKMPQRANSICRGAVGLDGMPVIFSTEIDHTTLQAGDFLVTKKSGAKGHVHCVTLVPATDAGELRTVLLIGEFGNADADAPARVEVTGRIHAIDRTLDFKGTAVAVTPLEPGPTLILAERFDPTHPYKGLDVPQTRGDDCPAKDTLQAVRVVWAGGVTLANGKEPGAAERGLYRVTVRAQDGTVRVVAPTALADLGDGDNNHLLCLSTTDRPVSVAFPAGIFTDPNGDLNPATSVKFTIPKQ
jgi:hypothetical protein